MVSALRNACVPLIALSLLLSLTRCDRMVYPVDEEMVTNIIHNLEKETEPVEEPEPEGEVPVVQKPEEPVLYASYPFNGNADDESGNGHNATVVGPSLTSDRFGNENSAYLFDGEDDYIILHYLPYFPGGNSSRSITGWFNSIDTEADIMMLFGFGYPDTTYNFQVGIGPNYKTEQNEFRVNAWGDTFDWRTGVTSAEYLDGKWHHVAVTYDGEVTMFYIDGILGGTTSDYQYYTDSENSRLVIGREIDLDEWEFNGVIDDVSMYTGVLSPETIGEMAQYTPPPPPPPPKDDLYAYYPFNGNAVDATGNGHDATVSGAELTADRSGNTNSAYLFDGIDDYVIFDEMDDFPEGNVPRSITGWFRSSVEDPNIMMLFGFGAQEGGYNFQVGVGPGNTESAGTQYRVNGWGDSFDWRTGITAPLYLDGLWHHCAVTYDCTTTRIYFDGELKSETDEFTYTTVPQEMVLVIGREIDLDEWEWKGAIDEVKIFTKELSAEEVKEMVPEPPPPPPPPKDDRYAYYPFSGNAADATGNGHDGEVSGAVLTTDRFGNENSAYLFDGVDDYIICSDVSDFPVGNVERTVAGWFKSSAEDPYIMMLFGCGAQSNGYNFQAGVGPNYENGETEFRVNGWGDSFDWRTGINYAEYLDGTWHHCAVTYDGTDTKIYFDGELASNTSNFTYKTDPESMVLVIGREIDLAGWEWKGALDDVVFYTRALDAVEVNNLIE